MRGEHIFYFCAATVICVISLIPYIFGYLIAPPETEFTGMHTINSADFYTNLERIEQGRQGHILFKNLYTGEDQPRFIFRPSYLIIGLVSSFWNLDNSKVYHVWRVIYSIIFLCFIGLFLNLLLPLRNMRILAFLLISTSSGLGWLLKNYIRNSIDLNIPEAITFMSIYESPHFIFAQLVLLMAFYGLLKFFDTYKLGWCAFSGMAFLLLGFEHPFTLEVAIPVAAFMFFLYRREKSLTGKLVPGLLLSLIPPLLSAGYHLIMMHMLPSYKSVAGQNVLSSPSPVSYFSGYGLILLFAITGICHAFKNQRKKEIIFLAVWALACLGFSFIPLNFQRRLCEGLHIPLSILAACGFWFITGGIRKRNLIKLYWTLSIIFVISASISNFGIVGRDMKAFRILRTPDMPPFFYLSKDFLQGMRFLTTENAPPGLILSSIVTGNFIPGIAGRAVYVGHEIQTAFFKDKINLAYRIFSTNDNDQIKKAFLRENNIKIIFYGPFEKLIGYFNPEEKNYLEKIFENSKVKIFSVLSSTQ